MEAGYLVAVASRKTEDVQDIIDAHPDTAFPVRLNVTDYAQVRAAVQLVLAKFGRIDVLVNNAGIGYFAAIEESEEEDIRNMFEVNFWGLSEMTRQVLPFMRGQHSGHIINIASIGGLKSFPSLGYYHATKYAVDGLSEALFKEVSPLGIKVTIVAPGAFRTDWAGRSAKDSAVSIPDYAATSESTKQWIRGTDGKQAGNPVLAAKAIITVVEAPKPPLRLLLGQDALEGARIKLSELTADYDAWQETTLSCDF
ncbi:short-chain dehydrogenase/reductase [Dyadobacter beijingensis]|uniref:Short-chain dehydrogenase/reductase n=1 Tax=Dyadobacter beijingensis TaxID=365489 RepID=A0ABQ2IL33_9BACT|nr:short-chain dehydrogenase/reductase [Dyadobacter beijingensis]